jgi:hypothetical protein
VGAARRAERTAAEAAESGPVKLLGRVGLVAYGTFLLLIVAAGLAWFGTYCLFDARYRRG